jgi:hypothetical protein
VQYKTQKTPEIRGFRSHFVLVQSYVFHTLFSIGYPEQLPFMVASGNWMKYVSNSVFRRAASARWETVLKLLNEGRSLSAVLHWF